MIRSFVHAQPKSAIVPEVSDLIFDVILASRVGRWWRRRQEQESRVGLSPEAIVVRQRHLGLLVTRVVLGGVDLGLPMPNVEQLYLGDGNLSAEQQEMNGRDGPYLLNQPLAFRIFAQEQPFFVNFPFGYTSHDVNWFEAAGIPLTAYDDFGRENPWPLMRVQARSGGQVMASVDTVLPISGEANCGECHNAPGEIVHEDGSVNTGIATQPGCGGSNIGVRHSAAEAMTDSSGSQNLLRMPFTCM